MSSRPPLRKVCFKRMGSRAGSKVSLSFKVKIQEISHYNVWHQLFQIPYASKFTLHELLSRDLIDISYCTLTLCNCAFSSGYSISALRK